MTILENQCYDGTTGKCGLYDLYLPGDAGCECDDLFIYIHGGGIAGGDKAGERRVFTLLAEQGIASASINYRMYPDGARFPVFIEDCAKAVAHIVAAGRKDCRFKRVTVGGSSAGGYLSMMLFFDPQYLGAYGISPRDIDGWFFDAGQPTTHFNILAKERGIDPVAVRIDEAAPMYFVDRPYTDPETLPRIHFVWAENDMTARPEQNALMVRLLRHYGYPQNKLTETFMPHNGHCEYVGKPALFAEMIAGFLSGFNK
ncbi:MAG: alpha/beta hydrolase [Clostridia bacterium]|nr:alpha/beta hydrolase [Clostridia bacterium]